MIPQYIFDKCELVAASVRSAISSINLKTENDEAYSNIIDLFCTTRDELKSIHRRARVQIEEGVSLFHEDEETICHADEE